MWARAGVAAGRHRCVGTAPVRPPTRLRVYPYYYEPNPEGVYPRYYPGRNAVRECNATYVQEYRPSGTVIVPRTAMGLAAKAKNFLDQSLRFATHQSGGDSYDRRFL